MQVYAHLRNLRIAPRKVRLVIDLVRGMKVEQALNQLAFSPKISSEPVAKLIKSAAANAEHNFQADVSTLRIVKITADGGPTLTRSRARAHGSSAPIRKRTTHITIILSDEAIADVHKNQGMKGKKRSSSAKATEDKGVLAKADETASKNVKAEGEKQEAKKPKAVSRKPKAK